MTRIISISSARRDLLSLAGKSASPGREFILTHHGRPAAVLSGPPEWKDMGRERVAAVILAAGRGKFPRARERIGRLIEILDSLLVSPSVIVTDGEFADEADRLFPDSMIVEGSSERSGFARSLKTAVRLLPRALAGSFILFAGHPVPRRETIRGLLDIFISRRPVLVEPVRGKRRGHPIILSAELLSEAERLDPRWGLVTLVRRHRDKGATFETDDPAILGKKEKTGRMR